MRRNYLTSALAILLLTFSGLVVAHCAFAEQSLQEAIQLYGQGRYREAIQIFQGVALTEDDTNKQATALYYRGLCQQRLNNIDAARSSYDAAYKLAPKSEGGKYAYQAMTNLNTAATTNSVHQDVFRAESDGQGNLPDQINVSFTRDTSNHIFVDGYMNGRPVRFMFDTGAEQSFVSGELIRSLNLQLPSETRRTKISGSVGDVAGLVAPMTIQVGGVSREVPVLIADGNVAPLLGQSWFRGYDYQIDNPGAIIRFTKKGSRQSMRSDVIKVPFQKAGNDLLVMAKINGRNVPMIFDTGANGIMMSMSHAQYAGITIPPDASWGRSSGIGGSSDSALVYVDRIELGPILKTHMPVWVSTAERKYPLLGQDFFRDRPFTIDYEENVIKFVP